VTTSHIVSPEGLDSDAQKVPRTSDTTLSEQVLCFSEASKSLSILKLKHSDETALSGREIDNSHPELEVYIVAVRQLY
ncbi:hypothetical protein ACQWF6_26225, partial [Salmonella enterica subsp. enterica serovar Infantis]